jgi:hypothetical protein
MQKPEPTFTLDDLLASLKPDDIGDGLTIRELCDKEGSPATTSNLARIRKHVNDLVALGLWEYAGKKALPTITGSIWSGRAAFRPVKRGEEG